MKLKLGALVNRPADKGSTDRARPGFFCPQRILGLVLVSPMLSADKLNMARFVLGFAGAGYTVGLFGAALAINATLYHKLNFNFVRDCAGRTHRALSIIMVLNPSAPAKTLPEFIAYANPGKINMASPDIGSSPHVNGELFKFMTRTNLVHVPYRSAATVMTDLLSGQVQLYFGTTASSLEYVRTGKLRALAVTIERRLRGRTSRPWASSCQATRRQRGRRSQEHASRDRRGAR